jgi:hypothetical protein
VLSLHRGALRHQDADPRPDLNASAMLSVDVSASSTIL